MELEKNIFKKALYDGPSANLRPLYNCNGEKITIVNWTQILISTTQSSISGIPRFSLGPSENQLDFRKNMLKKALFNGPSQI